MEWTNVNESGSYFPETCYFDILFLVIFGRCKIILFSCLDPCWIPIPSSRSVDEIKAVCARATQIIESGIKQTMSL